MELLQYWSIIRRRLWLIIIIPMLSGVSALFFNPFNNPSYVSTIRVLSTLPTQGDGSSFFRYDRYYAWLSSEYLADDLAELVKSQAFRSDVTQELLAMSPAEGKNSSMDGVSLQTQPRSTKSGRVLTINVSSSSLERTKSASEAVVSVIEHKSTGYFSQIRPGEDPVRVIDPPMISKVTGTSKSYLALALRVALALVAGVALSFFLHYLDNTLYEAWEVERFLQVPVIGEVPRDR